MLKEFSKLRKQRLRNKSCLSNRGRDFFCYSIIRIQLLTMEPTNGSRNISIEYFCCSRIKESFRLEKMRSLEKEEKESLKVEVFERLAQIKVMHIYTFKIGMYIY